MIIKEIFIMKILKKKSLIQKLIFLLCIILVLGTIFPKTISYASSNKGSGFGGKLMRSYCRLFS